MISVEVKFTTKDGKEIVLDQKNELKTIFDKTPVISVPYYPTWVPPQSPTIAPFTTCCNLPPHHNLL